MSTVTIVIPTYNRIRAFEAVWPSYIGHPDVARIVVVDDGSTDRTSEVISRLAAAALIPVEIIRHEEQRGQPASRLTGIAASNTKWVLFGEDDVWLTADYCSTLLREAETLGASVIAGRVVTARVPGDFSPDGLSDPVNRQHENSELFDLSSMDADFSARPPRPVRAPFLHSIALIRRKVFDDVSFDRWYTGNSWREETDFYLGANAMGAVVYFTPNAVCYHLRGPICSTGGQRVNRLRFEYLAWRNTRYLVSKHWEYLKRAHGFRGSVNGWMVKYYARRQMAQLRRAITSGARSTYRG
ncbi:MAG: glycosyltransferase family 2 protein [Gemmatimonadaceae bacterium]|nr:glycosyltransferase family 2 protein [Gemmatimonadaceae bacterium]